MAEYLATIADDEPLARTGIRRLLEAWPMFTILYECRNGAEAIASIREFHPDLVFLDVEMPGIDGMDVVQMQGIRRLPLFVFVTAHEQFAVKAFEADAVDYLVKPVSEARFRATMERVLARLAARGPDQLTVPTDEGERVIAAREIDWIESADDHAVVHVGSETFRVRTTIAALEDRLVPGRFLRLSRAALVPLDRVRELRVSRRVRKVILADGTAVPVSRRRLADVRNALRSPLRGDR